MPPAPHSTEHKHPTKPYKHRARTDKPALTIKIEPACRSDDDNTEVGSDSHDDKLDLGDKPKSRRGRKQGSISRPWTGDEYLSIFDAAVKRMGGPSSFDGVVEGRSRHQAYLCWRQVVQPTCRKALAEKGKANGKGSEADTNGDVKPRVPSKSKNNE